MVNKGENDIQTRKNEHIDIVLHEEVNAAKITSGLDRFRLRHNALPELDFAQICLQTFFLNKQLRAPFIVSSMTGGTTFAHEINLRLAEVAETNGWAMAVGSMRAAIENEQLSDSFKVRSVAPSIPLIANIGAVQLNYGFTVDHCQRAVEMIEADALVLHLNALQEVFQPEGNTNFAGLLSKIEQLCRKIEVPIGVKEVGWGIDAETAIKLVDAGVEFIDVAGAGGTSWSQVEKYRASDPIYKRAAEAFADWGNTTADCITEVRNSLPNQVIIGSGGINNGVDAAKALCLGADLVGFGQALLAAAVQSTNNLQQLFAQIELELRIAMFAVGVQTIEELKLKTDRIFFDEMFNQHS